MEPEESRKPKKTFLWSGIAFLAVLAGGFAWASREPFPPYPFLKHFPVVEWRNSSEPGVKVAILKGDSESVWKEAKSDLSGRMTFTSTGMSNVNGTLMNFYSTQTENGIIKVSNDLKFADGSGVAELKDGYCAVAFTRPKSLLDRALESIKKLMGIKEPQPAQPSRQFEWTPSPPPSSGPMLHV